MPSIPGFITLTACGLFALVSALGLTRLAPEWVPGPLPLLTITICAVFWALRERYARFRNQARLLEEIDALSAKMLRQPPNAVSIPVPAPVVAGAGQRHAGLPADEPRLIRSASLSPQGSSRQAAAREPKLAVLPDLLPETPPGSPPEHQLEPAFGDMADGDEPIDDGALFEAVRDALNHNRVEIHAQPIVQLPTRRLRYVELFARTRDQDGREMVPGSYLPALRAGGLVAEFDALMLLRGVQLVRKLESRTRNIGFFCNIAAEALATPKAFDAMRDFLAREREQAASAGSLILEFNARGLKQLDRAGMDRLNELSGLGYVLSVDGFETLDIDLTGLARRGVRFIKLDAGLLLDPGSIRKAPVALADFAKLCARNEIEPILAKVENEHDLTSLAALGFRLGQGHLFGLPTLADAAE